MREVGVVVAGRCTVLGREVELGGAWSEGRGVSEQHSVILGCKT